MTKISIAKMVEIQELFTLLFGGDTEVVTTTSEVCIKDIAVHAVYVDAEGEPQGIITADFSFANSSGAALTMISPGFAMKAIANRVVDAHVFENVSEIMNICVNLFSAAEHTLLRLAEVSQSPLEADVFSAAARTQSIRVFIPRYSVGTVTIAVMAPKEAASPCVD